MRNGDCKVSMVSGGKTRENKEMPWQAIDHVDNALENRPEASRTKNCNGVLHFVPTVSGSARLISFCDPQLSILKLYELLIFSLFFDSILINLRLISFTWGTFVVFRCMFDLPLAIIDYTAIRFQSWCSNQNTFHYQYCIGSFLSSLTIVKR